MIRSTRHLLLLAIAVMLLSACSRITSENFDKIKVGMTVEQVKTILGSPAEMQTQGAVGLNSTTYTYKKGSSEIKIVFLNDRVMAKNGTLK